MYFVHEKEMNVMNANWIRCPVCGNKTRDKIREDTILMNYLLYCPKCKQESLIQVKQLNITIIKEPDAKTQSRWTCEQSQYIGSVFYFSRLTARQQKNGTLVGGITMPKQYSSLQTRLSLEGF